jgi:hypothetical protein
MDEAISRLHLSAAAGHFDGHADALEQCTWHCHDNQGNNIGSLWTLPSGDYSLYIAPMATRMTINKTTMKKTCTTLLAISMAIAMWWFNIACIAKWRRSRASQESTGCHHWASILSDNIIMTHQPQLFVVFVIVKLSKKGLKVKGCPNKEQ